MNNYPSRVVLFNPPTFFFKGKPYTIDISSPPLGIMYLGAYISKYLPEIEVEVVDIGACRYSLGDIESLIRRIKPFVVGISSMTAQLQGTVELAQFIKEKFRDIKIFIGGNHISADPDFLQRFSPLFDYAITGEAEKTFTQSVIKLLNNVEIPRVQSGDPVINLDDIPFPHRNINGYRTYIKRVPFLFSRGCPYDCYFCSRPSISRLVRYRSPDNLIAEIKETYPYHKGKLYFQDDAFTLDRNAVLSFCKEMMKKEMKVIWACQTRIDLVDADLLYAMKISGCDAIIFGIESGNEYIRKKIIKKNFTDKQIYEVFQLCKKYNIKTGAYFMFSHPGERPEQLRDTIDMIFSLNIDILILSVSTPFPGSELYDLSEKYGIIDKEFIDKFARKEFGCGYAGIYPVFVEKEMHKDYIYSCLRRINRRFYLKPRALWSVLIRDMFSARRIMEDLRIFIDLLFKGISHRAPYVTRKKFP